MSPVLAVLLGCNGDPEAPPSLTLSADALDFGEVAVGLEATDTFTLTNDGGGSVELLSIQLTDGEPSAWTVVRDDVGALGAGESLTVTVTFHPGEEGTARGRIQVRSDDPTQSTHLVDLEGAGGASVIDADQDGYTTADGDCDDGDASSYPGASEICDGRDNDCDGDTPVDEADADGDGFRVCEDDCDDAVSTIYPGAPEICDDADSDCDGVSADREDRDGDGFDICGGDCDDDEAASWPGNTEVCDEVDNDCSGGVDDIDEDADGHTICHPAGDCDDNDHEVFPIVVDASWTGAEAGTEAEPFNTIDEGMAALNECRVLFLGEGDYTWSLALDDDLRVIGTDATVVTAAEGDRHFDVGAHVLELESLTLTGGSPSGDGGSVRVVGGELWAADVVWQGNGATGDGGAIALTSGVAGLDRCELLENIAEDDGGGVAAVSSELTLTDSSVEDNQAVRGGGLLVEGTSLDVDRVRIVGNVATDAGGGVNAIGGAGVDLTRSHLALNEAATGGGAVLYADVAQGTLSNNVVQDNSGGTGAAIELSGSGVVSLHNNTVVTNTGGATGGIAVDATGTVTLDSNLVCFNDGYGVTAGTSVVLFNSAYGNTGASEYEDVTVGANGNDDANPLFVSLQDDRDPDNDDLTLGSGSPAIDSGSPARDDLDGTANDRGHTGGPEAE